LAAVELLIRALDDFDHELRIAAADALGRIGQKSAARPLRQLLQSNDEDLRLAAERALEILGARRPPDQPVITRGDIFSV
jgi:HEAT repeat protein